MKLIDVIKLNKEAEAEIRAKMPYNTWTFFNSKQLSIAGDQVSLTDDGDYKSIEEAREACDWLVGQLGGKVKWEKV